MRRIVRSGVVAIMTACLASVGVTGEFRDKPAQPIDQLNSLRQLARGIDRWHEANLEGDKSAIDKHEQGLLETMEQDIDRVSEQVRTLDSALTDEEHPSTQQRGELARARQLLHVKKKIYAVVQTSEFFSYKYRLFNDYQELLRKEVGLDPVELAAMTLLDQSRAESK